MGDISQRQGISVKYIDQLMQPLKKAGFIRSVRGPKGGYLLQQTVEEITLGKIVAAMEGRIKTVVCLDEKQSCGNSSDCLIRAAWQRAISAMFEELDTVKLSTFYHQPGEDPKESPERPCGALLVSSTRSGDDQLEG